MAVHGPDLNEYVGEIITLFQENSGPRWLPPQECTAACRLIVLTLCFGSSHLHHQAPPCPQRRERPLAGKKGTIGDKCPAILPTMAISTPL
jgi:hypothetical protein